MIPTLVPLHMNYNHPRDEIPVLSHASKPVADMPLRSPHGPTAAPEPWGAKPKTFSVCSDLRTAGAAAPHMFSRATDPGHGQSTEGSDDQRRLQKPLSVHHKGLGRNNRPDSQVSTKARMAAQPSTGYFWGTGEIGRSRWSTR